MKIKDLTYSEKTIDENNYLYTAKTEKGRITILDRVTGFEGEPRDIETGYKDNEGLFWLASGDFDIRRYGELSIDEAIEKIKENANNCIGI